MLVLSLVSGLAPVTSFMQSVRNVQSWAACLVGAWGSPLICSHSVGQVSTLSVAPGSEYSSSTRGGMFFLAPNAEFMEMS